LGSIAGAKFLDIYSSQGEKDVKSKVAAKKWLLWSDRLKVNFLLGSLLVT